MSVRYTVLAVPGTSESSLGDTRVDAHGMCRFVTDELRQDVFECRSVNYPSSFGWPMSEEQSMAICLDALIRAIRDTDLPVLLLGYSQGAQVVRRLLGLLAAKHPSVADLVVVGAGLIADPNRSPGVNEGPALSGFGIAGVGPAWPAGMPVWEIAYPGDPITNSPAGSLWRPFADVLKYFTVTDPVGWVVNVMRMLVDRSGQGALVDPRLLPGALHDLWAYAFGGQHVAYFHEIFPGTNRTYCQHLADLVNDRFAH